MAIAKELADFEKRYLKLAAQGKGRGQKEAAYKANEIKAYVARLKGPEEEFTEAVVYSRDEGFSGDKYQAYLKDKDVADAVKAYRQVFDTIEETWTDLRKISEEADAVADGMDLLLKEIGKKFPKPDPGLKKDLDGLVKRIEGDLSGLKGAATAAAAVPKDQLAVLKDFDANLNTLIRNAPASLPKREKAELPEELEPKEIATTLKEVQSVCKAIAESCVEIEELQGTDAKKAKAALLEAVGKLKDVKAVSDALAKARKDARAAVAQHKEKSKIIGAQEMIARLVKAAGEALVKAQKALA